jgi:aminoacyl tRNA synthase complex-interacting multifunctional protein 1
MEPLEELRTEQLPQTIVESWEELRDYQYEAATTDTNGQKQQQVEKEPKQKQKSPPPPAATTEIDISQLDIRVGLITKAWEHTEADKLFCEEIDLGEEGGPRQIASGLKAYYSVDDLVGRKVLVLANLKERKLLGFPSHGMVLCASDDANGKVQFVDPPADAQVGERIVVEGFDGEPATENQVLKKKMLDAIFPDLKTNAEGVATYKGVPLSTSAGVCKSGLSNVPIG